MSEIMTITIKGNEDVNSLILKEVENIANYNNSKVKWYAYDVETGEEVKK